MTEPTILDEVLKLKEDFEKNNNGLEPNILIVPHNRRKELRKRLMDGEDAAYDLVIMKIHGMDVAFDSVAGETPFKDLTAIRVPDCCMAEIGE